MPKCLGGFLSPGSERRGHHARKKRLYADMWIEIIAGYNETIETMSPRMLGSPVQSRLHGEASLVIGLVAAPNSVATATMLRSILG